MPRNASQVYAIPVGTEGIPNTTVFSGKYNTFIHDVETDLNTPRPVVAGGTGSTSADGALVNLSGEKAAQVVTNWDSQVWMPGSFYAATTASGAAPVAGHAFVGVVVINEPLISPPTNQNVVVEARDMTDPANLTYYRIMTAGVWGPWLTARQSIYAAPFDALAYNGMQVNGSFEVSQEIGSTPITVSGYVCDSVYFSNNTTAAIVAARSASSIVNGLSNMVFASVTGTPIASPGAADAVTLNMNIEGFRSSRLGWGTPNAQPITIAFWCQNWRTGIYSGSVRNNVGNRSYAFTYTQNVSNASEFKTITIPGDTGGSGTWLADNNTGIRLDFAVASGSTGIAPSANTWFAGTCVAAPGQVNAIASTSDAVRIAGLVVLPGADAPSAARSPFIMRSFDQELLTCQRYWRPINSATGIAFGATTIQMQISHPNMRVAPSVGQNAPLTVTDVYATNPIQSVGFISISSNTSESGSYNIGSFAGLTIGRTYFLSANKILLDARL